ncbi:MAG: flagellar hook-basal body protein [Bacteriovoracales bacterium]
MKEIWVPLSGAIAQQRNVDNIANNLANTNTPGFKKDQLTFKEYLTVLEKAPGAQIAALPNKEFSPEDFYRTFGAENSQVLVDASYTDQSQGQLDHTGNPLDLAINGPAHFEILSPNGIRYTRRGTFSLNNQGILVNEKGFPVLSNLSGQPQDRIIKVSGGKISINQEGELFVDGNNSGKISLVEFIDPHATRKEGNSLFINNEESNLKRDGLVSTLHQGFLESSNVNALEEMTNLIKASRHFESIQQIIKAYDNMAGKAVNEISKF